MPSITRAPRPALLPFVQRVWATDDASDAAPVPGSLERVLPTGTVHIAIRLSPAPLTLFDDASGANPRVVGHCVVGGARSSFYVRDIGAPSRSVGAQLRAGAASLLFGIPGGELAERHVLLEDVWGHEARRMRERLAEAASPAVALALFESLLISRLPTIRALHPAIAQALASLTADSRVTEVARNSGYSHRTFLSKFRDAVGLPPKTFSRIARFQRATLQLAGGECDLAGVATACGYSDQSHFTREFSAFAGVSPGEYRGLAPLAANHVPVRG